MTPNDTIPVIGDLRPRTAEREAFQLTSMTQTLPRWAQGKISPDRGALNSGEFVVVSSRLGNLRARLGDWIVRVVAIEGEFEVYSPEAFARAFEQPAAVEEGGEES